MKGKWSFIVAAAVSLALLVSVQPMRAQDSTVSTPRVVTFYVDQKTGQVFIGPGRGRVPMQVGTAVDTEAIAQQVEAKTRDQVRAAMAENKAEFQADTASLQQRVSLMEPAWKSYVANWQDKFHVGALFYGDYRFYTHAGFQPQELTQLNNPGQGGNNDYNSFDITRTYLNFFFFPTKDWTLRLTPNLYKTVGSSNDKIGQTTGFGSNLDGNLGVRMKYAYIQYANLWNDVPALKGGTLTMGEIPNPLVAWEEDLYGYRYVNLTPWNYLSLSSTQTGVSMEGPVKLYGGERTYLEFGVGVYTNASFHAFEQTDTKQVMAKLTAYPFGALWRFQGLGLTGFYNYGYGNTTPDNEGINTPFKGTDAHITRIAALVHYATSQWNIAGEFDYGNNAFTLGNMFSGSGPADAFGTATGPAVQGTTAGDLALSGNTKCSSTKPCYNAFAGFGPQTAVWQAMLNNGRAREIGWDVFGHYNIPSTKLSLFGMFQWFLPNDNIMQDPLDFQRFIAGVSYQYNEYLRFALDSQNVLFYHSQFGIPVSKAATFNYVPGAALNGRLTPSIPSFVIPDLVPRDTHSIFLNVEFAY